MAKQNKPKQPKRQVALPPAWRLTLQSLLTPLLLSALLTALITTWAGLEIASQRTLVLLLGSLGGVAFLMGYVWYGPQGMGLRGGRPFWSGAGFAFMGWVALLLARLGFAEISSFAEGGLLNQFLFLLIFEGFAVQIWTFGVFFRSMADWRGPIVAALSSGLLFGGTAFLYFGESFEPNSMLAFLYFASWGIFYGIIRLRTGSLIGIVLAQAIQSLTTWYLLQPSLEPEFVRNPLLYIIMTLVYLVLIWRLWPKQESDYRV